jgi:hypothetical protein
MKSPHYKLTKALNNLRIILQIATRPDLTMEEAKLLKGLVKSFELSLSLKERQLEQHLAYFTRSATAENTPEQTPLISNII